MSLPAELRQCAQWLVSGEDKAPRSVKTGRYADVRDASLYVTYDEALAYARTHGLDVGFALTSNDPFTVIDLDAPETVDQQHRHKQILEAFDTFAELSRSGQGIHIWVRGSVPRGVRRDKVELYSDLRYIICTGNVIKDVPIRDQNELLHQLFLEVSAGDQFQVDLDEEFQEVRTDMEVVEMASAAVNGEKFDQLCAGDFSDYPSQSEADYALMNIIAFYTKDNEQCRRIFRMSALGKREKAHRDKYLNYMLRKIRGEETPLVDFSHLKNPHENNRSLDNSDVSELRAVDRGPVAETELNPTTQVPTQDGKNPVSTNTVSRISYPPGFLGEIAQYIVRTAVRPVQEVGIAAALAMMAGIFGRQFNVSGTGLNLYIILLAKTGVGKEGGSSGIDRLMLKAKEKAPVLTGYVGPGTFASGQAIIRTLDSSPSFFSVLGEFGMTLQMLSDGNAAPHQLVMRRVLLDLYSKSGEASYLQSSAYSDKEKNTKTLRSPALTIFGESTPESFFAGLSSSHIAEGLVPRFLVIEYRGDRPERNRATAFEEPPTDLVDRFLRTVEVPLRMQANNQWHHIGMDEEARQLLADFDQECDAHIRKGNDEGVRQIWNRAHLKSLRVAALVAVVDRPHEATIRKEEAEWAIELIRNDCNRMQERFESGDVGEGQSKLGYEMEELLREYTGHWQHGFTTYRVTPKMHAGKVIPENMLVKRLRGLRAYKQDRRGALRAVKDEIQFLIDSGVLIEVPKKQMHAEFGNRMRAFMVDLARSDV